MATPYAASKYRPDQPLIGHKAPSEKQKEAGNYAKGHTMVHGMRVSIENEAGTTRRGFSAGGKVWSTKMQHDYGYLRGTKGRDKDHLDVFLGPDHANPDLPVHVIDQRNKNGDFDEHKVMAGFPDADQAIMAYHSNYEPGWDGFMGSTEMSPTEFKAWAPMSTDRGKAKPAADYVRFKNRSTEEPASTQNLAQDFADGGSVDDPAPDDGLPMSRVTPEMLDASQEYTKALGPPVMANPHLLGAKSRPKATQAQNQESAQMPLALGRGLVTGTLGLGGDIEGLLRGLARNLPVPRDADAIGTADPVDTSSPPWRDRIDDVSRLPTSDFFKDALPGKELADNPKGQLAEGLGSMVSPPLSSAALGATRLATKAGPKVLGALGQVATDVLMGPGTAAQKLGGPKWRQTGAVKLPGGNWLPDDIDNVLGNAGAWPEGNDVADWMTKKGGKWMRNQMGTATDPLLQLEKEGKLHLTPDQLGQVNVGGFDNQANAFHQQATGRTARTPWENLTDSTITNLTPGEAMSHYADHGMDAPSWMQNLKPDAQVHSLLDSDGSELGLNHVMDYLNSATDAHKNWQYVNNLAPDIRDRLIADGGNQVREAQGMVARGLHIDPAKLGTMSFPDVVRKVSDWNDLLAQTQRIQDVNKGIKQVVKTYPADHPNAGMQWAELDPEGLQGEGNAMGHCVGGYCPDVSSGNSRILSLRDAEGQPHVTVELSKAPYSDLGDAPNDVVTRLQNEGENLARQRGLVPGTQDFDDFAMDHRDYGTQNWIDAANAKARDNPLWNINQIKGKQNAAPVAKYLPAVQDLVKNLGPWGDNARDLQNAGLRHRRDVFSQTEMNHLIRKGVEIPDSPYMTKDEIADMQKAYGDSVLGPLPTQKKAGGGLVKGLEDLMSASGKAGKADRIAGKAASATDFPDKLLHPTAVKNPGGNWYGGNSGDGVENLLLNLGAGPNGDVPRWLQKRLPKYLQNQMGTTADPLLQLEQEGRLHLTADQLEQRNATDGLSSRGTDLPGGDPVYKLSNQVGGKSAFHADATGRNYRTPWENLSDAMINGRTAGSLTNPSRAFATPNPDWLTSLGAKDPGAKVYSLDDRANQLGFDHVKDYLNAATTAHGQSMMPDYQDFLARAREAGGNVADQVNRNNDLITRNLHIDPAKLPMMSLPDVVRKTADWNDMLAQTRKLQDVNKGIKTVLKQYPDTGHQWVELNPEGLGGEGQAMGHCVGGYCDSVASGAKRILSLRDKDGQPHVTVELRKPAVISGDQTVMNEDHIRQMYNYLEAHHDDYGINAHNVDNEFNTWAIDGDTPDWFHDASASINSQMPKDAPWNIQQIKGKQNAAPTAAYQPAVQDLVKNMGPWGDNIGDLRNTGLTKIDEATPYRGTSAAVTIPEGYHSKEDVQGMFNAGGMSPEESQSFINQMFGRGYAQGGRVVNGRRYLDDGGSAGDGPGDPGNGDPGASGVGVGDVGTSAAPAGDPGTGDPGANGVAQGQMGTDVAAPSNNNGGIFGMITNALGIHASPTVNSIGNFGLSTLAGLGLGPMGVAAMGLGNAAINGNASQGLGSMGSVVGSGIAGPVGGIAGAAIGNAIGGMSGGVSASSVGSDPSGGGGWYEQLAHSTSPQAASAAAAPTALRPQDVPAQLTSSSSGPRNPWLSGLALNGWQQGAFQNGWGFAQGGRVPPSQRRARIVGPLSRFHNTGSTP